ncbi:MAG: AAA family ATPase [Candidatus Nanopelagicaceae bacterium]|nr:AAA family ATPase [Candidatus Nanopelagicaceae bacterium]
MLIVMAGLPKSGKTTFASRLKNVTLYSPDLSLPDLSDADEEKRKQYRIAAWDISLRATSIFIRKKSDEEIVVFDTTGSNISTIENLFDLCVAHDHRFLYFFIHDSMERCTDRFVSLEGKTKEETERLMNDYRRKLLNCITKFKSRMKIIKNDGSKEELEKQADVFQV